MSTAPATAQDFVFALTEDLNKKDLELPAFPDSAVRIQHAMQSDDIDHRRHAWDEPLFVELCPALAHVGICAPDATDVDLEPYEERIVTLRHAMGG